MSKFPCAGGICTSNASPAPTLLPHSMLPAVRAARLSVAKMECAIILWSVHLRDIYFIPAMCLVIHTLRQFRGGLLYLQTKTKVKSNPSMDDGSRPCYGKEKHFVLANPVMLADRSYFFCLWNLTAQFSEYGLWIQILPLYVSILLFPHLWNANKCINSLMGYEIK